MKPKDFIHEEIDNLKKQGIDHNDAKEQIFDSLHEDYQFYVYLLLTIDNDGQNQVTTLRGISTSKKRAERSKDFFDKATKENNFKREPLQIEKVPLNHGFALKMLKRIREGT